MSSWPSMANLTMLTVPKLTPMTEKQTLNLNLRIMAGFYFLLQPDTYWFSALVLKDFRTNLISSSNFPLFGVLLPSKAPKFLYFTQCSYCWQLIFSSNSSFSLTSSLPFLGISSKDLVLRNCKREELLFWIYTFLLEFLMRSM